MSVKLETKQAGTMPNESSLKYPQMEALKLVIKIDPLQLGLYYTPDGVSGKKKLYIVELQNLLAICDPQKITEVLYQQHASFFDRQKVPFNQVRNLIDKMLEFIIDEMGEADSDIKSGKKKLVT